MSNIAIFAPATEEHYAAVRQLFREYIAFLYTIPDMAGEIANQDQEAELIDLENGKYAAPHGAILLAKQDNKYIGVVALRALGEGVCEMKRLYVSPEGRGNALGRLLALHIIDTAKAMGYKKMLLDTHPSMKPAHKLYYSLGFRDVPQYNDNTVKGALFMELVLN